MAPHAGLQELTGESLFSFGFFLVFGLLIY